MPLEVELVDAEGRRLDQLYQEADGRVGRSLDQTGA
jgi:hypothetical protein